MPAAPLASPPRVALKIDVDTFRGTRDGVPARLDDLAAAGVRAAFFFPLGPAHSGRAVLRIFRKRGFLAKMLRTNAARMYGWRTALYGTLLPAPDIGRGRRAPPARRPGRRPRGGPTRLGPRHLAGPPRPVAPRGDRRPARPRHRRLRADLR